MMLDLRDLTQWDRFVTPSIVKPFYTLAAGLIVVSGVGGLLSGLGMMAVNPFLGLVTLVLSILGTVVGLVALRIVCEVILITFRINEHLGAIRDQNQR